MGPAFIIPRMRLPSSSPGCGQGAMNWAPTSFPLLFTNSHSVAINAFKQQSIVMLSAAKHLVADGERPFAAAQGDREGKYWRDAIERQYGHVKAWFK
jgi:hypothetical protein